MIAPRPFSTRSWQAFTVSETVPVDSTFRNIPIILFCPSCVRALRSSGWKRMTNAMTHTVFRLPSIQFRALRFSHWAMNDMMKSRKRPMNIWVARVPFISMNSL